MYIYGASGHAKVIIDLLDQQTDINGVFDDNPRIIEILGYPVQHEIPPWFKFEKPLFIAIGDNLSRKRIAKKLSLQANFATIIDNRAIISRRCFIGEGSVVMEGAIIKVNAQIGKQVIINTGASVDHDCWIGDFVHIAPQAALCGDVSIGEGTIVGANALILPGISIGSWCKIGAGSVVNKDVPDGATWIGYKLKY